jgi:selenocysteine lyase/cysteine desulfurase
MMAGRRHFLQRAGQAALGLPLVALGRPTAARPTAARPRATLPPTEASDFWEVVRTLYPMTRERTYLNTGGLGPAPYPVLDAVERATTAQQTIVEHGHERLQEIRGPVAAFFGAKPDEIAFTRNATEGNSTISSGLDLRPGDEVIFESHAHPGGAFAWLSRQKRDGIRVKIFEPDPTSAAGNLERIAALVTPRTRVIQVSHITAPTGIVMPVEEIAAFARERGLWFHVDGAQSAGLIPVDLHAIGCDSYATSGHKWLGAPHGTGLLYVREDRLDEVWPTEVGAYSADGDDVRLPDAFEFVPTAQRYEPGTRDTASILGFAAAVAFLDEIGMERVAARARHLAQYLHERLFEIPGVTVLTPSDPTLRTGMTTLRTDRVPYRQLYAYYSEAGIRCRPVSERELDAVRVSTHLFNSEAECDRVVDVTREALDKA